MMAETPYAEDGLEGCVDCEELFGHSETSEANLTYGPVYDTSGTRYETVLDTEAGTALLHPECWQQREIERRREENATMEEFQ